MKINKSIVKNSVKKALVIVILAITAITLFACKSKQTLNENFNGDEQTTKQIAITPEEAARGKTVENTKRTVNEYGNTIYGRKLDKSEPIYNEMSSWNEEPNKYTYTEYYSDAYGGIVYITTTNKSGGIQVFNEKGEMFMAGKKPQNDIEVGLANYRMGNAMAEAIDRSVENNK